MIATQSKAVDVGIIIASEEEFEELNNQLGKEWKAEEYKDNDYYLFERSEYCCVAILIDEKNPASFKDKTKELIKGYQPLTLVLVGISDSLSSNMKIGDVIIANEINDYQQNDAIVEIQASYKLKGRIINKAKNLQFRQINLYKKWQKQCSNKLIEILNSKNLPELIDKKIINNLPINKTGKIASGARNVNYETFKQSLKQIDEALLAVDIESYNFLETTSSEDEPEWKQKTLILRGISDGGNKQKAELEKIKIGDEAFQRYAMHNALQFLWAFLETGNLPRKESQELQKNLKKISTSLKDGKLVIFLGSGINYSPGNSNMANLPPSDITIADKLSQSYDKNMDLSGLPCEFCPVEHERRPPINHGYQVENILETLQICPIKEKINSVSSLREYLINEQKLTDAKRDIKCWAQFILNESENGSQNLSEKLRNILKSKPEDDEYQPNKDDKYQPNEIQKALAKLALEMAEKNMQLPLTIATSNYDYGLEKAFEEQRLIIDVISYINEGRNAGEFCYGNYTPETIYYQKNDSRFKVIKSIETTSNTQHRYDVFLSYNRKDLSAVESIKKELEQRQLSVWMDKYELRPGLPWQPDLEEIITNCKSAAICFGNNGIGAWEENEMYDLLLQNVNEKKKGKVLPVIPVFLPGSPKDIQLPTSLRRYTFVDLSDGMAKEKLDDLEWGITGVKPGIDSEQLDKQGGNKAEWQKKEANKMVDQSFQSYRSSQNVSGKIIKLYGGVLYKSNQREYESFTIAESHKINYLKENAASDILAKMTNILMKSDMLFIGYSANDTDLLRILQRLLPERFSPSYSSGGSDSKPRGWLIHQSKASAINEKYWNNQNVTPIKCGWEDFIKKFKATL